MAKILIVDDERDIVLLLRHLLTENGHEVREAPNGLAGLSLFQTQFFDLVITDVRMPTMDGMAFLREVKQLMPSTPVVVVTAYDSVATATAAMEQGAVIYLVKPFKVEELLDIVAHVLSSSRACF